MKMKLTVCTDTQMFSKKVENNLETLLEDYNIEKCILLGMPLENLPLNCEGLPLILQKIYDYIIEYGLYECYLFDEIYSKSRSKENFLNAYKLVSGSEQSCRELINVEAVDVATVLMLWLYYLPKPLISSKQFFMICDQNVNKNYQEIINSMENITRRTLQRVINIVDYYEKQHKYYKDKLRNIFTMLFTKNFHTSIQHNGLQFIENLKKVVMNVDKDNDEYLLNNKSSDIEDNVFNKNELCIKRNQLHRSLSDNGLQLSANKVNITMQCNALRKSNSCNLVNFISKVSEEEDAYKKSFINDLKLNENNLKSWSEDICSENLFQDSLVNVLDESIYSSHIDDIRNVERTMPTHSRSNMKKNKNKSIKTRMERILKLGLLSNEDSLLLQNTLELMKILSKIKSVQHQINIQRRNWEYEFGPIKENSDFPELYFLNNRIEHLNNQKNNYLTKTGLSYGTLYNRTVQNLKNVQKDALKLYENEKKQKNAEKLLSDIYNIQIVLDYLKNKCGGKELPWRSSDGCPGGYKRKTNKELNCVTVVSDLQTISEHEVMETISQPLFIPVEH